MITFSKFNKFNRVSRFILFNAGARSIKYLQSSERKNKITSKHKREISSNFRKSSLSIEANVNPPRNEKIKKSVFKSHYTYERSHQPSYFQYFKQTRIRG